MLIKMETNGGGGISTPQLIDIPEGTTTITQKMKNGYIDCQPNSSPSYCYARGYLIDGVLTVPYQQNATMTYDNTTGVLTITRHYSTGARIYMVN